MSKSLIAKILIQYQRTVQGMYSKSSFNCFMLLHYFKTLYVNYNNLNIKIIDLSLLSI